MHLLLFLLFGLVVGAIARIVVPGRESGGWLTSILIGILESFVGGFLGLALGMYGEGQPVGFLMSVFGSIVLLVGYHALVGRQAST